MKRFLALMLSAVLSVGVFTFTADAKKFKDVPASNETLTKAVELLQSLGITTGTTESTYGTSEKVTRQQMATFIYRLLNAGENPREGAVNSTSFTDIDDPFYYQYISWANAKNIIKGRSDTIFDPNGNIILQDAYTMLTRALEHEKNGLLSYPVGYITKAEDIGLDEGLDSSVDYTTELTRGDVAILLYNAVYADMGTGNTAYENIYEEVNPDTTDAYLKLVAINPYTVYDNVASKIFGLKKTIQRVVATHNYSLDDYEKTVPDTDSDQKVRLSVIDEEYNADKDMFGEIDLASLKLTGDADDLFLLDIAIYYKEAKNGTIEIYASNVLGERKKDIPGASGMFELSSGWSAKDFMYVASWGVQSRFKKFTGKLVIEGMQDSYLFNAPWSYLKPGELSYEAQNAENASLIFLGESQRDNTSEDFVQDYNFKLHKDAFGRGKEYWETVKDVPVDYDMEGSSSRSVSLKEEYHDERGGGLYSPWGIALGMLIDLHSSNKFEVDVWDSDGDGRVDYLWYKPYSVGVAKIDEGKPFNELHNVKFDTKTGAAQVSGEQPTDNFGPIYDATELPTIYTHGATVEGEEYTDGQIITGYINGPANYIKVSSANNLRYQTKVFDGYDGELENASSVILNGISQSLGGWLSYFGLPVADGGKMKFSKYYYSIGQQPPYADKAYKSVYFTQENFGEEFMICVLPDGEIFHIKPTKTMLSNRYAVIFPNDETGNYAFTVSVGKIENGVLSKTSNYIPALINGVRKDVPVKPNLVEGLTYKPVTPKMENDTYDFSDYVGELLSYTRDNDGNYVFELEPVEAHKDVEALKTSDSEKYYVYQEKSGEVTPALVEKSNGFYQFVDSYGVPYENAELSPFKYLKIQDSAKIVIKSTDDEGNEVFNSYTKDTLPSWSPSNKLSKIHYIVKNNPDSATVEELVYLFAEIQGGETGHVRNVFDYRIIKGMKTAKVGDEIVKFYDVYNPFTGKIEEEYKATDDLDGEFLNAIYPLTTKGYISKNHKMGDVASLGKAATDAINASEQGLGLRKIEFYDEEMGFLSVVDEEKLFIVDDDTVVTFLNLEDETIETKTANILNSTSKLYRCGENKNVPLVAFIASSEIKREEEFEHAELIVVVRCDALEGSIS